MDEAMEEPMLKYSKFYTATIKTEESIKSASMGGEAITAISTTDRFIAIGSKSGNILLLDAEGNLIKEWRDSHSMAVNHIEIDSTKEFIASASTDGTVVIASLYNTTDSTTHNFKRPILALALEPDFGKKSTRQFVCGGPAGSLILNAKGWFGPSQTIIHKDEGTITSATWNGSYIVWANEKGVNIYDTVSATIIGHIEKNSDLARGDLFKCNICWTTSTEFIIGWANSVKLVSLKPANTGSTTTKQPSILSQFTTDYIVAGVAPLDSTIVLLGSGEGSLKEYENIDTLSQSPSRTPQTGKAIDPPEIHIVNAAGTEIANDVLSMAGYQDFSPSSYRLGHISLHHSGGAASDSGSADYVFYISSPRDVICAKPRDVKDHVAWLMEAGHFRPALNLVEKSTKEYTLREKEEATLVIGQKLIEKLLGEGAYAEAAEWCPKVLGSSEKVWEKWVLAFTDAKEAKTLSSFVPIANPRLSPSLYEVILNEFMQTDLDGFHKLILRWPSNIYNIKNLIKSVQVLLASAKANNDSRIMKLYDILADLCELDKQMEMSIYYSMLQGRPGQAERLEKENLFTFLHSNVLVLMEYALQQCQTLTPSTSNPPPYTVLRSCANSKSLQILVTSTEFASIPHCVSVLSSHPILLHIYLDALFTLGEGSESGQGVQDRQVELYATYDPPRLLDFLRAASSFSFPQALQVCEERDLVPEMLYLLGKMGDTRKALHLIIERVGDVEMAIEFAKEHNDASLWTEFLKYAMDKPAFIVGLLRNSGGHIDPLQIIEKIPRELEIPDLKSAIIQIMTDCSVQLSLREGCGHILQSDIWDTFAELTRAQRFGPKFTPSSVCSLCEDPITEPIDHLVVFYCSHYFHASCIKANISLMDDSIDGMDTKRAKLAILDKAIDFVYNRTPQSMIPTLSSGDSTWVDTKSITCPLCL